MPYAKNSIAIQINSLKTILINHISNHLSIHPIGIIMTIPHLLIKYQAITFAVLCFCSCNKQAVKAEQSNLSQRGSTQSTNISVSYDTIRITDEASYIVKYERIGNRYISKGTIIKYIDNDGNEISDNDPRCETRHQFKGYYFKLHDGDSVFYEAEIAPIFPGGKAELESFIKRSVVSPYDMKNEHPAGRVVLQCQIKKDGTIDLVRVSRSIDPKLDAEAIRVVKSLPRFSPATIQGMNVSCWYTLVVPFQ